MKATESTPTKSAAVREEVQGRSKRSGRGGGTLGFLDGFSPVSPPKIYWNSRRRSVNRRSLDRAMEEEAAGSNRGSDSSVSNNPNPSSNEKRRGSVETAEGNGEMIADEPHLSDRRRALFQPLERLDGKRIRPEDLLPPPDFDSVAYPKGWLVGKKRKLVNVDVVDSMRRIALQEMNRKDREIDGLNEQLEEDGRCLERLQLQLLEERSKRVNVEREKTVLEKQVAMLMDMFQEAEPVEGGADEPHE